MNLSKEEIIKKLRSIVALEDNVNYSQCDDIYDLNFAISQAEDILASLTPPPSPPLTFVEAITRFRNSKCD